MDRVDLRCLLDEAHLIVEAESPSAVCACAGSVGTNFLAAISDPSLRELYHMIIERVRSSGDSLSFSLRCDTPEFKRLSWVRFRPRSKGAHQFVEVENGTWNEIPHAVRVTLLDETVARGPEFVIICSWCKQVKLGEGRWGEVEDAMRELQLFHRPVMPSLSHGLCPDCARRVRADFLRQIEASPLTSAPRPSP
ncbi:hypothetical protein [Oleiharenicola sp. Vm1]|uniref:hypothetical protein n=1 Tax=Oleiharenicola sp. Vm1 TaxID=3398393 RepID=UPI0039F59D7E